jgi:hypothetical protein
MSRTVFKFHARMAGDFTVRFDVARDAVPLAFQLQRGLPCLWMEVTPHAPRRDLCTFELTLVGTGQNVPDGGRYVGTVQLQGGDLVLHGYLKELK